MSGTVVEHGAGAVVSFALPAQLLATEPPEQRGLTRDRVRLVVANPTGSVTTTFRHLGRFLCAGDLLVVNTSATRQAALDVRRADGTQAPLHLSTVLDDDTWVVEVRRARGLDGGFADGPATDVRPGEPLHLPGGRTLHVGRPYPDPDSGSPRLWRAVTESGVHVDAYLRRYGRPIRYGYVPKRWPMSAYRTVFGSEPGSAEMPSAGRPFTARLVTDLVARGVVIAPLVLHTGVSSPESHEPPYPERYDVPAATARSVNAARADGGRIIAVGTTVTRALETVADLNGWVHAGRGWTDLVLGAARPARVVEGLITGWHPPEASHLMLLEAVAGTDIVQRAYDTALRGSLLWHEFGDSCLLLP